MMNVLNVIDKEGEVTNVAAEAQIALQTGDTARSARLFRQAGEMLESSVARLTKPSERSLARFLAATHFYKGGAYQEAARVCGQIRERNLPARVRHLYPPFLKDLEERSAPDYIARYKKILENDYRHAIGQNDPTAAQKVIDILKDHQYILPHSLMAYVRARCCEIEGKRQVATLFYRKAWGFEPDNPHHLLAYLDSLCKEEKHAEAWAIVEDRRALIDRWIELSPDSPTARALREIASSRGKASCQGAREGIPQVEHDINEYSLKRFEEASPILDASLV